MEKAPRQWFVRSNTGEITGPFPEDEFETKLRAGEIPFFYEIKSSEMSQWRPLVQVVSEDPAFHRPSTIPPEPPE